MRASGIYTFIVKKECRRAHVMVGGPLQKEKYWKVAVGIGSHVHVEMYCAVYQAISLHQCLQGALMLLVTLADMPPTRILSYPTSLSSTPIPLCFHHCLVPHAQGVYILFSLFSFSARYSVVNLQGESRTLKFREVIRTLLIHLKRGCRYNPTIIPFFVGVMFENH